MKLPSCRRSPFSFRCLLWACFTAAFAGTGVGENVEAGWEDSMDAPQMRGGPGAMMNTGAYKLSIEPRWYAGNTRFWYRNDLRGGSREFITVDLEKGERLPAFDHAKLAAALSQASGAQFTGDRLPFSEIRFSDDGKELHFDAAGKAWKCILETYECAETGPAAPVRGGPQGGGPPGRGFRGPGRDGGGGTAPFSERADSPDGKWTASIQNHNIFLRAAEGGEDRQLSSDGSAERGYQRLTWSPDSATIVAFRVDPGAPTQVHLLESSPAGGGPANLRSRDYPLPGDKFDSHELNLFDASTGKQSKPEVEPVDLGYPVLRWKADQHSLMYEKADRGHQRFRIMEVDSRTGASRALIDEKSETFIWTAHFDYQQLRIMHWLTKSAEAIHVSEKSGWRHLYLVDLESGKVANPITSGSYVVRGIDHIDEEARQIWFTASGKNPDQDPYFLHHYRVNFDGTGLVALTEGNGTHTVQYSPDRKYLVDTWSRVDAAPVHELRSGIDGRLIVGLEEADIAELLESGWKPPTVFTAKGRDGETDIWGIIVTPKDFDPAKKYPVIEDIYAGPHSSYTPKSFSPMPRFASLADRGFIIVKMDGMGTANRSKAFHDVCWQNLKDAGFPDRILWMKAAAEVYPYLDLTRVGLYGGSAGGQNAAGAVLFHPEFYKVAVAGCGCHDNRMDKSSWNEQWMGYPVGPHYSASSNIDNAHLLGGKLLLIVGELDDNVPPESTYRFVDALIKAGKDLEFVLVPGAGHGMGGPYGTRKRDDFFVKHLLGEDPPERNLTVSATPEPSAPEAVPSTTSAPAVPAVTAPPESFFEMVTEGDREAARAFYGKYLNVGGLPVVAAKVVDDEALRRSSIIVNRMLANRPDILAEMVKNQMYLIIIGKDQLYTDMPEYRNSRNPDYLNERVRGTGGRPTSFGEENVLSLALDRYDDESIALHEFSHTIDGALRSLDPEWRGRLNAAYQNAVQLDLYGKNYAASNPAEYWAEICQAYFDCNRINNWNHSHVGTREVLLAVDPVGHELVRSIFNLTPEQDWRFPWLPSQPKIIDPPHRFGIDSYYRKFSWAREMPVIARAADDAAILKANDIVRKIFTYRHDVLKAMIADGVKVVVLAPDENFAELPEIKAAGIPAPSGRSFGYHPATKRVVIAAESLETEAGGRELASLMWKVAYLITSDRPVQPPPNPREIQQYELHVTRLDERFGAAVRELLSKATAEGKWTDIAASDPAEYWGRGVAAYFGPAGDAPAEGLIASREALQFYDPALFALVHETMAYEGRPEWRISR